MSRLSKPRWMKSQSQGIQSYTIEQFDASKTTVEWLLNSQEQHPEEVQTQSQEDTTPKKKASQRVFNEEDDDEIEGGDPFSGRMSPLAKEELY